MKTISHTESIIVVEWTVSSVSGAAPDAIGAIPATDLRALAQALGRLAARRDLAQIAAQQGTLGPLGTKVKVPA